MTGLGLYTSNRLGRLAGELAERLRFPLASPFDKEIILVQSRGMERWLSMRLAEHHGVCANCGFPFPNAFVHEIFRGVMPALPERSIYDARFSAWKIMEILADILDTPGLEPIKHYLQEPGYTLKGLQLSIRIAETFDQYVIYRPELIASWDAGQEDHWQAKLWRELSRGREHEHRAALRDALLQRLERAAPGELPLPRRVSVFGISYLPPFHLQILKALSRLVEVNLFLLSPCMDYWGDIVGKGEMRRLASSGASRGLAPEDLHLEKGNSLLASMGMLGRDFFQLLIAEDCDPIPLFEDPADPEDPEVPGEPRENSLLACLQSDILNMVDRAEQAGAKKEVSPDDRSLQIHSCHSPMREVEVLYDHLLELFEREPDLLPKDILVMAPDIESFAPFVHAVFNAPDADRRIPFSIADASMRKKSRTADSFMAILDLRGERLSAPQVLSILESPSVQARFNLTESDFEVVTGWVADIRIRWGIDEASRLKWSPVAFRENTWSAGIDRLLLGYAMPGNERLFQGILPFDNIEGSEASILGGFLAYLDALFGFLASLETPRTLSQWSETLLETLSTFFLPDAESELEIQKLRQLLGDFKVIEEVSGFNGELGVDLLIWYLKRSLEQEGFGEGFITGGVTFCSMLPMRSIPFRVLCLVGMNENAFPRQSKPPEFDLIARSPRPGDRSLRNEDRYLFLEALISAREKLYLSYAGQSSRDNTPIPPSVLVSELMDTINGGFTVTGSDRQDWFLTRHRLQHFNPAYFKKDTGYFSYSREHLAEARCLTAKKREAPVFISSELSAPAEAFRTVSIEDLSRFFVNPSKYLLNKRIGLFLEDESPFLEDAECFELGGLEKYLIEDTLLESAMSGSQAADLYSLVRAAGRLPHGTPGECVFKKLSKGVEAFAAQTAPYVGSGLLEPLEVDLHQAGLHLTGTVRPVYRERLLKYRYARIKAKDLLSVWISHLALNCAAEAHYPGASMLIGLENEEWSAMEYGPVEDGEAILARLLELYWQGLVEPLHFFPDSSLVYAEKVITGQKPTEAALAQAGSTWRGSPGFKRGECEDPYFELCFRSVDPLDATFQSLALEVFGPLLGCLREVSANG